MKLLDDNGKNPPQITGNVSIGAEDNYAVVDGKKYKLVEDK